jgi:hypothetical protein
MRNPFKSPGAYCLAIGVCAGIMLAGAVTMIYTPFTPKLDLAILVVMALDLAVATCVHCLHFGKL